MSKIASYSWTAPETSDLNKLSISDLAEALSDGWQDFIAMPTFAIVAAVIYPILGLLLARILHGYSFLPLLFPLSTGFALIGPLAAIFFYEMSRSRELDMAARTELLSRLAKLPSAPAVAVLGLSLAIIFLVWLAAAQSIYNAFFGYAPVASMTDFVGNIVSAPEGRRFAILACATGFIFAIVVFTVSVVSFPLLVDRKASAVDAVLTSVRVVVRNPVVMAAWGLIVAFILLLGMLPAFLGLAIAVPVLGHASWHLYRRAVP